MLFEMLHGGAIERNWRNPEVADALELCLACKGCKSDCPVNVDMATYKAEFRSHYYAGRLRPRAAYSMGLIHRWARLAHIAPSFVNAITRTPVLDRVIKAIAGIAEERTIPPFARTSFDHWFSSYRTKNPDGPPVLLFPDTFNNYFRPHTAIAATQVLEAAGWRVTIPSRPLCCGRPLYDWGMLDRAKRLWSEILDHLEPQISAGVPVIGLEPACVAAFRDELVNLVPDDSRGQRLSQQTFLLSEFIDAHADKFDLPKLHRKVLVQVHCHHHAIMTFEAARHVLDRMEADYTVLPSGCCGMARRQAWPASGPSRVARRYSRCRANWSRHVEAPRRLRPDRKHDLRRAGRARRVHRLALPASFRFSSVFCRPAWRPQSRSLADRARTALWRQPSLP
jgi:Fe-S oxidoreductase